MSSPLATYLKRHGVTQAAFARRGGWRQATVSGWCNDTIPSIPLALQIAEATDGEVTVADWANYASENDKSFPTDTAERIGVQDADGKDAAA